MPTQPGHAKVFPQVHHHLCGDGGVASNAVKLESDNHDSFEKKNRRRNHPGTEPET